MDRFEKILLSAYSLTIYDAYDAIFGNKIVKFGAVCPLAMCTYSFLQFVES